VLLALFLCVSASQEEFLLTDSDDGDLVANANKLAICVQVCKDAETVCKDGAKCAVLFRPNEDFNKRCSDTSAKCQENCNTNSQTIINCFDKCTSASQACKQTATCADKTGETGFQQVCSQNLATCDKSCEEKLVPAFGAYPQSPNGPPCQIGQVYAANFPADMMDKNRNFGAGCSATLARDNTGAVPQTLGAGNNEYPILNNGVGNDMTKFVKLNGNVDYVDLWEHQSYNGRGVRVNGGCNDGGQWLEVPDVGGVSSLVVKCK